MLASLTISLGVFSLPVSALSMYMGSPSFLSPFSSSPFSCWGGEGRKGRESLPPLPDPLAEPEGPVAAVHLCCPHHCWIGWLRGYQLS